jgi:hypothetical protein
VRHSTAVQRSVINLAAEPGQICQHGAGDAGQAPVHRDPSPAAPGTRAAASLPSIRSGSRHGAGLLLLALAIGCGDDHHPTVDVQPAGLAFAASSARDTPPSQPLELTVSGATSGTLYLAVTAQGQAVGRVSEFVRTSSTGGYVTVSPQPASALGAGAFVSVLTVLACLDATCSTGPTANTPLSVNVTYTVAGVAASPSGLAITVDDQNPASAASGQLQITGSPQQRWTASADVPWLSLSATSGATGDALTATLDPAQTDALRSDTYAGWITLVPDQGDPLAVPVALTVSRTQIEEVAPRVAISGRAEEVILRGSGFRRVTVTGVRFGTAAAAAFRVVSATELRATPPALSAGTYPVHLQDVEGLDRTLASLVVVDAPAHPAAALSYPSADRKLVTALVYDAQRQAILVGLQGSGAGSQVVRFAYGVGGWQSPTAVEIGRYPALALSTDGDTLLACSGTSLLELDPVTLATRATLPTGGSWDHLTGIGVANDGLAFATSTSAPIASGNTPVYRDRVARRAVEPLGTWPYWGQVAASSDGGRVFLGSTAEAGEVYRYEASTGALTALGVTRDVTGLSVDRTGARLLAAGAVYDGELQLLGALPSTSAAAVIAPDGARAYTYDSSGTLRAFDLTKAADNGLFPEIGSGTALVAAPDTGALVSMAITPGGGTVILAGAQRVIVQPVP